MTVSTTLNNIRRHNKGNEINEKDSIDSNAAC